MAGLLAAWFAVHLALRPAVSSSTGWDESEQFLFLASPGYEAGYSEQPPLFNWLFRAITSVTGPSVQVLAGVRLALMAGVFALMYRWARGLTESDGAAAVAGTSMLLVQQFSWEGLADRTHTHLATLLSVVWLERLTAAAARGGTPSAWDGPVMGAAWAGLVLSKYNAVAFAATSGAAALTLAPVRAALLRPAVLVWLAAGTAATVPHLQWAWEHRALLSGRAAHKVDWHEMTGVWLVDRLASAGVVLTAVLGLVAGLAAVMVLTWQAVLRAGRPEASPVSPGGLGTVGGVPDPGRPGVEDTASATFPSADGTGVRPSAPVPIPAADAERVLARTLLAGLLVPAVAILAGVRMWVGHWMLPWVVALPAWHAMRIARTGVPRVGVVAAVVAALAVGVAGVGIRAAWTGMWWGEARQSRRDAIFDHTAAELRRMGLGRALLLTDDITLGGNLVRLLPDADIRCIWYPAMPHKPVDPGRPVALIWNRNDETVDVADLRGRPELPRGATWRDVVITLPPERRDKRYDEVLLSIYGMTGGPLLGR